jgi:hypothetical protein
LFLKLILSPNVVPESFDARNMTSPSPFSVLLAHHATYTLSPEIDTGAFSIVIDLCPSSALNACA